MTTDRFIELNRHFRDITESSDTEEAAFRSYLFAFNDPKHTLGWDQLLESRLIVVLGEPGSGKTWEFRNRAKIARDQGVFAFFVPLDRLVDSPLSNSIPPGEELSLRKFKEGSGEGIFFLDSVDEAKLRNIKDFGHALDQFVRGVGSSGLARARILISSRISEWRWYADGEELVRRFGPFKVAKDKSYGSPGPPEPRIVQIDPLDKKQVRTFAEGFGVNDPDAFTQALDRHHAWVFARRPIDTADLITYWREHDRLGTLSELIEFDLVNKLKESPERNDPISAAQARIGAECLAAAVELCNRLTFFVPDVIPPEDGSALKASECLPSDWTTEMNRAILARAIFDSASYGRVRFHHRRAAEYLAAQWLQRRMLEGCPYPELEEILFRKANSTLVIGPRMRPIAAWLALGDESWNRRIRQNILANSPDLFLTHGDPESLPTEYKKELLSALIDQYKGRERAYLDEDDENLSRLADDALAPFIAEKLTDRQTALEIRILLIKIVRYGNLQDCLEAVIETVSTHEDKETRGQAVAAIRDIGDRSARERLARIAEDQATIQSRYCSLLCEALYPQAIGADGLANLLRKVKDVSLDTVDLPFFLKKHLEEVLPDDQASGLLKELLQLFQPATESKKEEDQIADQYLWLGKVIPLVLTRMLRCSRLNEQETELAARALWLLECFGRQVPYELEMPTEFQENLSKNVGVRRAHFWTRVIAKMEENPNQGPNGAVFVYWGEIVKLGEPDINWLLNDLKNPELPLPKMIIIKLIMSLGSARRRHYRKRIISGIRNQPELLREFEMEAKQSLKEKIKRFWYRHWVYSWSFRLRRWWQTTRRRYYQIRRRIWWLRHLSILRDGNATSALDHLALEASEDRVNWGANSWQPLIHKWGRMIARAAGSGWKAAWRKYVPRLPHEIAAPNQNNLLAVGLSGINVAISDGMNFADVTPDEARIACRYAINELNGVAWWFSDLVRLHPDIVRDVLTECVQGDWAIPAGTEHYSGTIGKLRYSGEVAVPLVKGVILEELKSCDPPHYEILEGALTILLKSPDPPITDLGGLAMQRAPLRGMDDPASGLWLAVWLQVDPGPAIKYVQEKLSGEPQFSEFFERFCSGFSAFRPIGYPLIENPNFHHPAYLSRLIRLVFEHIRPEEDTRREGTGVFTPIPRDDCQRYRDSLLERLSQIPGKDAEEALRSFVDDPIFKQYRDWILHVIEKRTRTIDDSLPWQPADIPRFMIENETAPMSDHQLFKIALKRMRSIKDEVERGDISSRYDLHPDDIEPRLRSWLARQLRERSRNRYTVHQETEIDRAQKPDLRIEAPRMGPVSIEVKWADNWSLKELMAGLAEQLVGQYLRAVNSNYGIYVVGYKGVKGHWVETETGRRLPFPDMMEHLENTAASMALSRPEIDGLRVFGIDISEPAGTRK